MAVAIWMPLTISICPGNHQGLAPGNRNPANGLESVVSIDSAQ
jgi:hypothetical protein